MHSVAMAAMTLHQSMSQLKGRGISGPAVSVVSFGLVG